MSAETFSRVYALLADRTSTPSGEEWEHGPLQRLVSDVLAVVGEQVLADLIAAVNVGGVATVKSFREAGR